MSHAIDIGTSTLRRVRTAATPRGRRDPSSVMPLARRDGNGYNFKPARGGLSPPLPESLSRPLSSLARRATRGASAGLVRLSHDIKKSHFEDLFPDLPPGGASRATIHSLIIVHMGTHDT